MTQPPSRGVLVVRMLPVRPREVTGPVILWVGFRGWLAPLAPGVRAGAYLRSAVPPVAVVVLLALGGSLLSRAPM